MYSLWHIDLYSPASNKLYLVRVFKGKTCVKVRLWSETARKPVEYFFATYGERVTGNVLAEPILPGDNWVDSQTVAEKIQEWSQGQISEEERESETYGLSCLCLPAQYLAYLYNPNVSKIFNFPDPPSEPAWFAFYSPVDVEDVDSFLLYLSAETGKVLQSARFRFPSYFNYGSAADW